MVYLQEMHEEFADAGLVVLGYNCSDKRQLALDLMKKKGVTYPTILDTSKAAQEVYFRDYRGSGVPLNYLLDKDGKVSATWYGIGNKRRTRGLLRKLGID